MDDVLEAIKDLLEITYIVFSIIQLLRNGKK